MADICFVPIDLDSRLVTRRKRFLTLIYTLGVPWPSVRASITKRVRVAIKLTTFTGYDIVMRYVGYLFRPLIFGFKARDHAQTTPYPDLHLKRLVGKSFCVKGGERVWVASM